MIDRDKGHEQAALIFHGFSLFLCLRHLLENFNKKFKNSKLQKLAKALAYSRAFVSFFSGPCIVCEELQWI